MYSNVILVRGDLVRPREAFDQMHRRTTQEGGEELSQILTPYHRMRVAYHACGPEKRLQKEYLNIYYGPKLILAMKSLFCLQTKKNSVL
ncbi:hypothetical protein L596_012205 [Steinernema carpocapsae]|uniref:Uncharacterized protein n=1 Tax=Steinernema carpocapsae TaxID=34508 RepID=A0A4U5NWQ7_STECR|nr:hypothetical protein L596_012205 [Steinernema carpocapsae]